MSRFFRSSASVYSSVCAQLDAAYGYPNAQTKTARALPLIMDLPTDSHGRVYLSIDDSCCEYILPSQMLPELLASGAVEEVTAEQYAALLPPEPPIPEP